MTRFLSQILGAAEPRFSQSIQQLERASGLPSADIRLTAELARRLRAKIVELGLDPKDTTGPELYQALHERLKADESNIRKVLGISEDAASDSVLSAVQNAISKQSMQTTCFALKASVAKRLLKKKPPKVAMKRLNYRSIDSMLKHEPVGNVYAAAQVAETTSWHRSFYEQYAKLTPSDFEMRKMAVLRPSSKRWQEATKDYIKRSHHNILSFKELGVVTILPLAENIDGLALTTMLLVLEEMNAVRSYSSFAKLQQVKPEFGIMIKHAAAGEPYTSAKLAGQPVPWRTIHRYYAYHPDAYHPAVFEPHVQPEDLHWMPSERVLATLEPSLNFWLDSACLGLLHEGQPVSCNVLDVALSYCNHLSFEDRIVHFLRDNIWHELMLKYLHERNLEEAVHRQLAGDLVAPDSSLKSIQA